jgi:hypothetical protein
MLLSTLLVSCIGPYPLPIEEDAQPPVCDGLLQPEEGVVDGPFDFDRDGFVDGDNVQCAETHGPHLLDCDDSNVLVNPGILEIECNEIDDDCDPQTSDRPDKDSDTFVSCEDCADTDPQRNPDEIEVCWDGIDNDCDSEIDPGCPDYGGQFRVEPTVSYTCAVGLVSITLDELELAWDPPEAELRNLSAIQPPALLGEIEQDGSFVLEGSIPGSCNEYYRLTGRFLDEDTFTAQFEVVFAGDFCGNCEGQIFPELTGTRY